MKKGDGIAKEYSEQTKNIVVETEKQRMRKKNSKIIRVFYRKMLVEERGNKRMFCKNRKHLKNNNFREAQEVVERV